MGKYLVVNGCSLEFEDKTVTGIITVQPPVNSKVKIENKDVYFGSVDFTISGFMSSIISDGNGATVAPGKIQGTSIKVKSDNKPAVLEGDFVIVTVVGTQTVPPSAPVPQSQSVKIKITSAGQTKVKGE